MDITTTEVADYVVGGVMACDSSRFDAILEKRVPLVLSVGALDMVNFGPKDTMPSHFQHRKIHEHNKQVISLYSLVLFCLLHCSCIYFSTAKNCLSVLILDGLCMNYEIDLVSASSDFTHANYGR